MIYMENNSTALVAFNTENTELGTVQHFIDTSTREGKIKLYSALQNAEKLDEHLNESLAMVNAVAQAVQVTDDQTGEVSNTVRVIIVTADNKAYAATSPTLAAGLNTMFGIFGTPNTWTEPLTVKVVERRSRRGFKFFTVEPVSEEA
jgi:hypothetical protein